MKSPIIINSMPRSGSSLVSKILYNHGVQFGNCEQGDDRNPDGFFQNTEVEKLHKFAFGPRVHKGRPAAFYNWFEDDMFAYITNEFDFYHDWAVKFSSMYVPPWKTVFPNSTVISCRRNIDSVVSSGIKSNLFKVGKNSQTVKEHIRIMEEYSDMTVNFENLVNGHFEEIEFVLENLNIAPDKSTIEESINKDYVHFNKTG